MSSTMLKEMDQRVASNESDDLLIQSFVQEYGERVLAEPPAHGFNIVAWLIPVIALALGLAFVIVVIRQWMHRAIPVPAAAGPPVSPEILERARRQADRETEE
jgi:cytochrome c-type biogenesis protein CcmH